MLTKHQLELYEVIMETTMNNNEYIHGPSNGRPSPGYPRPTLSTPNGMTTDRSSITSQSLSIVNNTQLSSNYNGNTTTPTIRNDTPIIIEPTPTTVTPQSPSIGNNLNLPSIHDGNTSL